MQISGNFVEDLMSELFSFQNSRKCLRRSFGQTKIEDKFGTQELVGMSPCLDLGRQYESRQPGVELLQLRFVTFDPYYVVELCPILLQVKKLTFFLYPKIGRTILNSARKVRIRKFLEA